MKITRLILASLLFGAPIGNAQASVFCFRLSNYVDVFNLNTSSGLGTDFAFYGNHQGYALPLVGNVVPSSATSDSHFYGLHGVNGSKSFFGNHSDCTFYFNHSEVSGRFTLNVACEGRVPGIWTKSAQAQDCITNPPPPPPGAKALGEAASDSKD